MSPLGIFLIHYRDRVIKDVSVAIAHALVA